MFRGCYAIIRFLPDLKREKTLNSTVFMRLFPQKCFLGEQILMIIFCLKAGVSN